MTDIATTAPATSEATPAPLPTLDAVVAAAEARAEGKSAPAPAPAAKPGSPKVDETKTPTINMDPATLKQLTKLQRENRELATKVKTADEQSKEVANAIEAQRLMKEGKRLEAMALLAGTDPDTELLALIEDHVKEEPAPKDDLTKKVEEIAKKQELSDKEKADAAVAAKAKEAEQAKSAAVSFATKQLDTLGSKYELCARADNKVEAAEAALDGVVFLAKERSIDLDKITQEEAAKLFDESYAAVEVQLEEEGKQLEEQLAKKYRKAAKAKTPAYVETANDVPGASRTSPGISVAPPKTGGTIEDIIARAEERAAAARRKTA